MHSAAQAVLASWSFPPWVTALNLLAVLLYIRGWYGLHRSTPGMFTLSRLGSFLGSVAVLELALASPIDTFDPLLLTDHMFQHMLLMMVVPPLALLGDPVIPLLHGLPRWATANIVGPFLRWGVTRGIGRFLTYPPISLLLISTVMIGWHLPAYYELALRSQNWHECEHASFLVSSFFFWWPVVQPWPSRRRWNAWTIPVYLLLADFVNTALSAFLVFSDQVFYPSYLHVPRLGGFPARSDQALAGAMMWVIGSFAYLIPAVLLTVRLLSPASPRPERQPQPICPESRSFSPVLAVLALALPLAVLGWGLFAPDKIDIDEDLMRAQGGSGPLLISVFTQRDPIPQYDLEVAVLVQDRETGETALDSSVEVELQPAYGASGDAILAHASPDQATNKLLAATSVDLPSPGTWNMRVSARRGGDASSITCSLEVAGTNRR